MRSAYLIASAGLLGCGDDGGSVDAAVVPTTVTLAGTTYDVSASGRVAIGGVSVAVYQGDGSTPVQMTTSAADGTYSLTITTDGTALDGYMLGRLAGKKDTYLYPAGPLTGDLAGVPCLMLTQSVFDLASTLAQGGQTPGKGWIGVQTYDNTMTAVAGVTITSTPAGTVRYNGTSGLPSSSGSMTMADGIGYIFNVGPGQVTVSASGGGQTFRSHPVNARADQVTLTLIQP